MSSRRCRNDASLYSLDDSPIRLYAAVLPYEKVGRETALRRSEAPACRESARMEGVLML